MSLSRCLTFLFLTLRFLQTSTPQIQARGRTDVSIYELVQLMKPLHPTSSSSEQYMYSPIILRRRDPPQPVSFNPPSDATEPENPQEEEPQVLPEAVTEENDEVIDNALEAEEEDAQTLTPEQILAAQQLRQIEGKYLVITLHVDFLVTNSNVSIDVDKRNALRAWESGHVDWMGAQQSDKIIDMLKTKIRKK